MKRVESIDPDTSARVVLATFTLVGDEVVSDFRDRSFQREIEVNGLYTMKTGTVRPQDGRAFYDALDVAFARSSFVAVAAD